MTLRLPDGQKVYDKYLATLSPGHCALCEKIAVPGRQYMFWKVIINDFPYERIAKRHDMLVPLRHAMEHEITSDEWKEYNTIKNSIINDDYDYFLEATRNTQSIPAHFHVHLITTKD